jgi:hypothetical protein
MDFDARSQGQAGHRPADCDAFYASADKRDDASLREKPAIVSGPIASARRRPARRYVWELFRAGRSRQNLEFPQARVKRKGTVVELQAARDAILIKIE